MRVKIPSIDLMFNGHFDQIEKNYMSLFFETGEQDYNYLHAWSVYRKILEERIQPFSNNIILLTSPFSDMVKKHWDSILEIYKEEIKNEESEILEFSGIVFDKNFGCILELFNDEVSFSIFDKDNGVPLVSGNVHDVFDKQELQSSYVTYLSKNNDIVKNGLIPYVYRFVFSVIFEKLIDEKEIVIVPPNGRGKTSHDKYINENKKSIKIWDSRKFNTYVRLDGFTVTGHIRHQRIGKDRKGHKLIWIDEFQKHGYNRNKLRNRVS
jgi:hypothetical protein